MIEIKTDKGAVLLPIKVIPGASRTRCIGLWENRVKISVASPAEKGKANAALIAFLAGLLGVRRRDVSVVAGAASPLKTVRIVNVEAEAVLAALGTAGRG